MSCPAFIKQSYGFTLIEALLAVSIMSILAGVLLMVINPFQLQAKGRDSKRVSNLKVIQAALDLHRSDNYGAVPSTSGSCINITGTDQVTTSMVPRYLQSMPTDPQNASQNFRYSSNGTSYILVAQMETATSANSSLCTGLANWNAPGIGTCSVAAQRYCYGLESRGN